MNITKDYFEYVSNVNGMNPIFEQYKFKCNKYSPMYKCNRLLIRIKEVNNMAIVDLLLLMDHHFYHKKMQMIYPFLSF